MTKLSRKQIEVLTLLEYRRAQSTVVGSTACPRRSAKALVTAELAEYVTEGRSIRITREGQAWMKELRLKRPNVAAKITKTLR